MLHFYNSKKFDSFFDSCQLRWKRARRQWSTASFLLMLVITIGITFFKYSTNKSRIIEFSELPTAIPAASPPQALHFNNKASSIQLTAGAHDDTFGMEMIAKFVQIVPQLKIPSHILTATSSASTNNIESIFVQSLMHGVKCGQRSRSSPPPGESVPSHDGDSDPDNDCQFAQLLRPITDSLAVNLLSSSKRTDVTHIQQLVSSVLRSVMEFRTISSGDDVAAVSSVPGSSAPLLLEQVLGNIPTASSPSYWYDRFLSILPKHIATFKAYSLLIEPLVLKDKQFLPEKVRTALAEVFVDGLAAQAHTTGTSQNLSVALRVRTAVFSIFERWLLTDQCWKAQAIFDYLREQTPAGSGAALMSLILTQQDSSSSPLKNLITQLTSDESGDVKRQVFAQRQLVTDTEHTNNLSLATVELHYARNGGWHGCIFQHMDRLLEHVFDSDSKYDQLEQQWGEEKIRENLVKLYDAEDATFLDFPYLIENANFCAHEKTSNPIIDAVVVVSAPVNDYEARQLVRTTWKQAADDRVQGIKVLFMLGTPTAKTSSASSPLHEEEQLYGDIVQVDFIDSYYNLTTKTLQILRWMERNCQQAKFVMEVDIDVFVNLVELRQFLSELLKNENYPPPIIGKLMDIGRPRRVPLGKHYTPRSAYALPFYPDYVAGPAILVPNDKTYLRSLLAQARRTPVMVAMEDVFITGVLAVKARIARRHSSKFFTPRLLRFTPTACTCARQIAIDQLTEVEIRTLWQQFEALWNNNTSSCD